MFQAKFVQQDNLKLDFDKKIEYNRLLVPLDGTDFSERAIPYAKAISTGTDREVHLLHVCDDNPITQRKSWNYLREKAEELQSAGINSFTTVVTGKTADQIVEFIENHAIDLIVMPSHGGSNIGQWIRGGISRSLAHQTHIPMLLIATGSELIMTEGNKNLKIVIPLDGTAFAETCLSHAEILANESNGELILLRINNDLEPPLHVTMDPFPEWDAYRTKSILRKRNKMYRYLMQISQQVRSKGINVNLKLLSGEAADEIVKYAEQSDVDLIAMSTHEHHGFMRVFWGSVSQKVIESTTKPVLLVRPHLTAPSI